MTAKRPPLHASMSLDRTLPAVDPNKTAELLREDRATAPLGTERTLLPSEEPAGFGDQDPRLGSVVAGRYRIDRLLGAGGCGRVYSATHLSLKSEMAIKFLLAEWASKKLFRERFRREAQVLSRLSHPGIVAVHDFGEEGGDLYLAMELVVGRTLADLLDRSQTAPPRELLYGVIDQLLQVLEVAHEIQIVHRDLKPANLMLMPAQPGAPVRLKVLDFGMAHVEESDGARLTESGVIMGTVQYMSPEHCRGRDIGPPSDIYSLGVIFYELLAGILPFTSVSAAELLTQHLFVTPPRPEKVSRWGTVAPELAELAMWALAKQPEKRPTASELRKALAQAVQKADPISRSLRSHEERVAATGLLRDERALTPHGAPPTVNALSGPATTGARVGVWGVALAAAPPILSALGTNQIEGVLVDSAAPPPLAGLRAAVLSYGPETAAQLAVIRKAALPALVMNVPGPRAFPSLIEAGASDLALAGTELGTLCRRIGRLLERGR